MMRRRAFITLLGGAAASWPVAARAQQGERVRRIGALMVPTADDPEASLRQAALTQGLQQLGWTVGRNVQIEYRWGADSGHARTLAAELVALAPDVILANAFPALAAVKQVTGTVPIVFVNVVDPIGAGFVESLARPGGNATGFIAYEYGLSAKWLELTKQIAPNVTRVAVLRDAAASSGIGQFAVIQGAAPLFGVELRPIDVGDAGEIERAVTTFARSANGGLIVTSSSWAVAHRVQIVALAARHRLPAVYFARFFVTGGGLMSYGPDPTDPFRRAADYINRILKGEKPADLPVQAPVKYELGINLKTAKALGLTVPDALLATATEVLE
jgi:putative ABC transport system substrate-binding protein